MSEITLVGRLHMADALLRCCGAAARPAGKAKAKFSTPILLRRCPGSFTASAHGRADFQGLRQAQPESRLHPRGSAAGSADRTGPHFSGSSEPSTRGASGRWLPFARFTPTLFIAFLKSRGGSHRRRPDHANPGSAARHSDRRLLAGHTCGREDAGRSESSMRAGGGR